MAEKRRARAFAAIAIGTVILLGALAAQAVRPSAGGWEYDAYPVTDSAGKATSPASCLFEGSVYLAYKETASDTQRISIGKWTGSSLDAIDVPQAADSSVDNPQLVAWGQSMCLIWEGGSAAGTGSDRDIYAMAYDGSRWSVATDLSSYDRESSADFEPRAVECGGSMHVFWQNGTAVLHRELKQDWTMGPLVELGEGWGIEAAALNGTVYAAWTTAKSPSGGTLVKVRSLAGGAWSPEAVTVCPASNNLNYCPSLGGFGGRMYVAWVTTDKNISSGVADDDVVVRSYDPKAGGLADPLAWSDISDISGGAEAWDGWPVVCTGGGRPAIVWQTWNVETGNGNDGDDIVARELMGTEWGALRTMSDTPAQEGDLVERGFCVRYDGGALSVFCQAKPLKKAGSEWRIWSLSGAGADGGESAPAYVWMPLAAIGAACIVCGLLTVKTPSGERAPSPDKRRGRGRRGSRR